MDKPKRREHKLNSKYYEKDRLLLLEITEEIDHHVAEKLRRRADYEIERYMPKRVVCDFNRVVFMDSAGIGMLIGRYKTANMFGGKLEICHVKDSVKKVFQMCGILKIIPICTDIEKIQEAG